MKEKQDNEIPEGVASAICWFGAHGCNRNCHRGRRSPALRGFDCGGDHPGGRHRNPRVSARTARDLRHRWIGLFPSTRP